MLLNKQQKYVFYTICALAFSLLVIIPPLVTKILNHEDIKIPNELPIKFNNSTELINKLKIKPTNFTEWKQRNYITGYLNEGRKMRIYVIRGTWYDNDDYPRLKYNHDETLSDCEVPCIWKMKDFKSLTQEELKSADALVCVNNPNPNLPKKKAWKGQKYILYTMEPKTHCPDCYDKNHQFDILATYDEDSDVPTSYVRMDFKHWHSKSPFNITRLSKNSPFVSFIASHWTQFREDFISSIENYIPIASFGGVRHNTDWDFYPECENLDFFGTKNCIISKYPFYLAIENSQEKDYSTEKLWDTFNLGVVPIIWGAPNTRSYLPHPKSAIFIEDFNSTEALANYLKYLISNETAYLEYHKWRTMKLSDEFEERSYLSMYNLECNICREVARLKIVEGYNM
ncbi:10066_t:CDS:1 [Dentiscutata erythropus]|uniref:Fucosyltransferase n=1 Tax=Dentiscutata erythropus TaxID=1348616 RepID=A0A9N9NAA8_9GLOM|nr:10066_t:CDS:1 [Dentiscutata erythropus]